MNETFDLLIIYWDGVKHTVNDVTDYGTHIKAGLFYYLKNGLNSYIPIDEVRFFGHKSDYLNLQEENDCKEVKNESKS